MKKVFVCVFLLLCSLIFIGCGGSELEFDCEDLYVLVGETGEFNPTSNIKAKFSYELVEENSNVTINGSEISSDEVGIVQVLVTAKSGKSVKTKEISVYFCEEGITLACSKTIIIEHEMPINVIRFGVDETESVRMSSSDVNVFRVANGTLYAVGFGRATIKAKCGLYETTMEIEVIRPEVESIETDDNLVFDKGAFYEISYNLLPKYSDSEVVIEASDSNIEIDGLKVKVNKTGDTSFVLKTKDGDISKEINVRVLENESPVIEKTSEFEETLNLNWGDGKSLLKGLVANDNADGDISTKMTFNQEDIEKYGERDVEISVADKAGNITKFTRHVNIIWGYHTKFVGHAGSIVGVPNTESGFLHAARDLHYQAIECDVNITKDDVLVTNHDGKIGDKVISQYNWDELKNLNIHQSCFGLVKSKGVGNPDGYDDTLCTLERYLEICKEYGCEAIIELKGCKGMNGSDLSKMPLLEDLLIKMDMWDLIIILSSTKECLMWFRNHGYTDLRCQYLVNSCESESTLAFCTQNNFDLSTNVTYGGANGDDWLKRYHDAGLDISVWTFTSYCDYDQVQEWIDKGVEYVTCDWQLLSEFDLK